uniref:Zinc finger, CCHC-type n=1 Tax=Tanacetum cinerariifolium TaxID=118510 RepID=A0A699H7D5_TANCI|nr:zinc finger, CCHC-type [Tanacetum cinerariifolium]
MKCTFAIKLACEKWWKVCKYSTVGNEGCGGGEFSMGYATLEAEEEKLLCETWIEVSESNAIGADRNLDTFCWQVTHTFNKATRIFNCTKDMITEITASTQRSHAIPHRQVMILAPGQPIPHSRPHRYHPNGPVHMMTARKRVRPLPVQQLAVRHSVDHSSSDYFSLDDSARNSSPDSSFEASSNFHSDASSDSLSRHSLSDHSSPDLQSTYAGPSHKRRRSPMTSVPALPPVYGALSPVRADLIPSPKRVRDSGYLADVEVDPRETDLRDDDMVTVSDEPHLEQDIDPEIQAEIDECFFYADALRDRGIDARVVVEDVDRDESETGTRGPVERFHDHTEAIPVLRIQVIEGVQREQGRRIVRVESAVTVLTERIAELEKDNRRLRGPLSVESRELTDSSAACHSIFSSCYLFCNSFSSTTMGDENPIHTLGDYSKPSHEGYRNTIELPVGNNVVPLRSDTIRLVQNECSFHGLRSEDPNQHFKDFLKLVDSFDLDGENRERMRMRLFQFFIHDQASNWLERLPAGSITTWEDLTTRFLAQFFLPERTAKLRNDILMFQQHHGESLSEAWTHFKDLL